MLLLAAAGAGCSGADPDGASGAGGQENAPVVLILSGEADGSGDARISGKLTVVGGCVSIEGPEFTYLAVWPKGTVYESEALTVPDGSAFELGDDVDFGGSYAREVPDGVTPEVPAACRDGAREVVVIGPS